jgi:hypothetical protein
MNPVWSFAQLHQCAVADNRRQPSRDLRLLPKLIYMFVSGQKGFLHRILCVSCIPQKSEGTAIKRRHAERQNVLQFPSCALVVERLKALIIFCP